MVKYVTMIQLFCKLRPDRTIQLSTVITNDGFYDHTFNNVPSNLTFVCMMKYADSVNGSIAFALPELTNTLGDYLSAKGLKQLRIAETEKYAHVTSSLMVELIKKSKGQHVY